MKWWSGCQQPCHHVRKVGQEGTPRSQVAIFPHHSSLFLGYVSSIFCFPMAKCIWNCYGEEVISYNKYRMGCSSRHTREVPPVRVTHQSIWTLVRDEHPILSMHSSSSLPSIKVNFISQSPSVLRLDYLAVVYSSGDVYGQQCASATEYITQLN